MLCINGRLKISLFSAKCSGIVRELVANGTALEIRGESSRESAGFIRVSGDRESERGMQSSIFITYGINDPSICAGEFKAHTCDLYYLRINWLKL